jgi:predicted dehydrogenase
MKIAVVGCGYWGTHLLRNFYQSKDWTLAYACDRDTNQLAKVGNLYPDLKLTTDIEDIINDPTVDALAIATPVQTHYEIALRSLEAGKHTWVEKPLTDSSQTASKLIDAAKKAGVQLHVDHTYIYTPAVKKIKELIENGELGDFRYFDSVRVNLGLFQHDINVVWDLAPHDFSILQYCIGKKPVAVNATGKVLEKYGTKDIESIAYISVHFEDNTMAHFNVNWVSPVKIRQIIVGGSKKMLVFNDMSADEKLKIYDSGVNIENREEIYDTLIQYRTGDMHSPRIENKEALKVEVDHFYECIKAGKPTITDGSSGLYVVKLLEAAEISIKNNGELVRL